MLAKLTILILGLGLLAMLVLDKRQERYEIVVERVQLHDAIQKLERAIQERKVQLAEATSPAELERMKERLQLEWKSIGDREQLRMYIEEPEEQSLADATEDEMKGPLD